MSRLRDPAYMRLHAAYRSRDLPGYFAAHDEIASRTDDAPIAKLAVGPGEVLILKCQADDDRTAHLARALGPNVRAVLLPEACEVAVRVCEGEGRADG